MCDVHCQTANSPVPQQMLGRKQNVEKKNFEKYNHGITTSVKV